MVYFALEYAAVFDPAAGFQARRLLVGIMHPVLDQSPISALGVPFLFSLYFDKKVRAGGGGVR